MLFLLVEDNEPAAAAVAWALTDSGHEVQIVCTGREVLGMINHHHPDVVILDITLPDVSGVVVAKWIRKDHPALPIIIATGHGAFDGMDEMVGQRRTAVVQKPYSIEVLFGLVGELMKDSFTRP